MKIGVDIAALTCKKVVDRIIRLAGATDFTPVAKLAHCEGIDFMPDPMWQGMAPDRHEQACGRCARCRAESIYRICTLFLAYCQSLDGQRAKG